MTFFLVDTEEEPMIYFGGGGPDSVQFIVGNNGILHPSATFTRASAGTTEIAQGVFSQAAVNEPRYQWVGGKRGLLIEPAATNLLFPSTDVTGWSPLNGSCTKVASQGGEDGYWVRVTSSTAVGGCYKGFSIPATSLVRYSVSMLLRNNGGAASVLIGVGQGIWGSGGDRSMTVNLSTGVISGAHSDLMSPSLINIGSGTYALTFGVIPTTTSASITLFTYGSIGADYLWSSMQMEAGLKTSSIKTISSAATRAPDIPAISASAFSFNQSEGAFVCEYAPFGSDGLLASTDAALGKYIGLGVQGATTGGFAIPSGGPGSNIGSVNRLAASYTNAGYFYASRNAAAAVGIANCDYTGGATLLSIGTRNRVTPLVIFSLPYYPRKYSAAELQAAST